MACRTTCKPSESVSLTMRPLPRPARFIILLARNMPGKKVRPLMQIPSLSPPFAGTLQFQSSASGTPRHAGVVAPQSGDITRHACCHKRGPGHPVQYQRALPNVCVPGGSRAIQNQLSLPSMERRGNAAHNPSFLPLSRLRAPVYHSDTAVGTILVERGMCAMGCRDEQLHHGLRNSVHQSWMAAFASTGLL